MRALTSTTTPLTASAAAVVYYYYYYYYYYCCCCCCCCCGFCQYAKVGTKQKLYSRFGIKFREGKEERDCLAGKYAFVLSCVKFLYLEG